MDWLNKADWELINAISNEGRIGGLLYKRRLDKERTEKEIEWLKKEVDKVIPISNETKPIENLIDLDRIDRKENLDEFNKREEAKLRTALEQIKDLPLKIISVSSYASTANNSNVGAEVVLDGTSILLKDGNKYRSSEAEKYIKESVKRIFDNINVSADTLRTRAQWISGEVFEPETGKISNDFGGIALKVSVIVNYQNQQYVLMRGMCYGKWITNSQ